MVRMEELARTCHILLSDFDKMLNSVSSCVSWMIQRGLDKKTNLLLAEYLSFTATNQSTQFNKKLHLIYLVNDVLHHCVLKKNDVMKETLISVSAPMF